MGVRLLNEHADGELAVLLLLVDEYGPVTGRHHFDQFVRLGQHDHGRRPLLPNELPKPGHTSLSGTLRDDEPLLAGQVHPARVDIIRRAGGFFGGGGVGGGGSGGGVREVQLDAVEVVGYRIQVAILLGVDRLMCYDGSGQVLFGAALQ